MNEDFKKWLCGKVNVDYDDFYDFSKDDWNNNIELLIKAMWVINREVVWEMLQDRFGYGVEDKKEIGSYKLFAFKDHNDSELKALTKALEYIYGKEKQKAGK